MKKIVPIAIITLVLAIGVFVSSAQAGTSSLAGWAWSSNIGWVSFNGANANSGGGSYNVTIATTTQTGGTGTLGGYAWSGHIGWISFEPAHVSGCPSAPCQATVNMDTGAVTGWARALTAIADPNDGWDGWIHLSGTNHPSPDTKGDQGITYYPIASGSHVAGSFAGYAWGSDVVGWLNFYNVAISASVVIPNTYATACSINSVAPNSDKTAIQINVTLPSNPPGPYDLFRSVGNQSYAFVSNLSTSGTITDNISGGITPGTKYTYQIFVRNTSTTCGPSLPYTEPELPVTYGLRLLIAPATVSDNVLNNVANPFDDSASEYQNISIKSGDQFKLKWNIAPELRDAGYDDCRGDVNPSSGPTGSWGNNILGGKTNMSSTGISGGQYTFNLTCTKNGFNPKMSTAKLYIISSSIRER